MSLTCSDPDQRRGFRGMSPTGKDEHEHINITPFPPTSDANSRRGQIQRKRLVRLRRTLFIICVASLFLALKAFGAREVFFRDSQSLTLNDGHNQRKPPFPPHHRKLTMEEREKLFMSIPNTQSALEISRAYATHPHLAGSIEDFEDAKVMLELFQTELNIRKPHSEPIFPAGTPKSRMATISITDPAAHLRGPTAWIDIYYPVMDTPLDRSVEILDEQGNAVWTADLVEDGDPGDPEAAKYRDYVPTWHGLSRDGDVSGPLIYANYGTKEDYEELVAAGVDLSGKIVIVRYGRLFRGLKVKGAQELGAIGVLIYSDPRDDGFVTVGNGYAPYPAGPARNPTSVQRGSVQFLSIYPGDPTTPGYPAYENSNRTEGSNIPSIPSLPISWKNAERLFEEIGELYLPGRSEGGTKRKLSGKISETQIRLVNHVDTKVTPIWNTMASIPGHIRDEVVVIACHRDAWVMGAADPTSGTVSLHEIIKGFGALLRNGWKPLRTVVFASWDAEEYGAIGSTEWGEDFASWISEHVVTYLNVDVSSAGSMWNVAASPSLAHLIKQTALDVPHPSVEGKTLWDARFDHGPFFGVDDSMSVVDSELMAAYEIRQKIRNSGTGIGPLGSGSDFIVFIQRLGVASVDQGFGGTPSDAPYMDHSVYDSQRWQEVYADPGFHRHVAVAKHLGLLALRIIDSVVLPLNTTQYALELDDYLDKVESIIPGFEVSTSAFSTLRRSIARLQSTSIELDVEKSDAEKKFKELLAKLPSFPPSHHSCKKQSRVYRWAADWVKGVFGVPPHRRERNVHSWEDYLDSRVNSKKSHHVATRIPKLPQTPPIREFLKAAKRVNKVNKKLADFELGFISEEGIKGREWYRHLGVAPGKWLGYDATTFPALTDAISFENNATLVEYEATRLTTLLDKLADRIRP